MDVLGKKAERIARCEQRIEQRARFVDAVSGSPKSSGAT
jgi:hypothetical protein